MFVRTITIRRSSSIDSPHTHNAAASSSSRRGLGRRVGPAPFAAPFAAAAAAKVVPQLPRQLVAPRDRHEEVDRQQVVVDRRDLGAVAAPDHARGGDGELLRVGDLLGGAAEVGDVGDGDAPLEGGGPEVDCSCGGC